MDAKSRSVLLDCLHDEDPRLRTWAALALSRDKEARENVNESQRLLDEAAELNYQSAKLAAAGQLYAAEAKLQARKAVLFALLAILAAGGAAIFMVFT